MKIKLLIIILVFTFTSTYSQGEEAIYTVTFDSNWSQEAHPHSSGALPSSAHWSRLVGAVHSDQISFLSMGELATAGVEIIAESGSNGTFNNEVNSAISAETALEYIDLGALDSDLGQITGTIQVSIEYPLVTLLSMIAPSPDWIIAVDGISLLNDAEEWASEITIDLYPYDAGTDNGTDYTSSNSDTNPAEPISSLQGVTPFSSDKIGTLTFSLDEVLSTQDINIAQEIKLFPNPTNGYFTVSLPEPSGSVSLYDLTGKMLGSDLIEGSEKQLDYSRLSTGVYMVRIESGTNQTVQRLIKQ